MSRADNLLEGRGVLISRKQYDASLPWGVSDKRDLSKIERKDSLAGFTYFPKNDKENGLLSKIFGV